MAEEILNLKVSYKKKISDNKSNTHPNPNLLHRRQEEITAEKEEIDRQKKLLFKKRPSNNEGGGGRGKRANSASVAAPAAPATPTTPGAQPLHNGTEPPTFLKPDPLPSMTWQEYYEADEILKVSFVVLSFFFVV